MSAVAVANIGAVHRVCHQNLGQMFVQWAARLENIELRQRRFHISQDRIKPCSLFAILILAFR